MSLPPGRAERHDDQRRFAAVRVDYRLGPLRVADMPAAPGPAFLQWLDEAAAAGVPEPNAMALATVGEDGVPSCRTVLLKGLTGTGFRFFTNVQSRKGRQLAAHAKASLMFVWLPVHRQVTVTGDVVRVADADADEYFASRPREAQIAAWASPQSQQIADRETLRAAWRRFGDEFGDGPVPRPPQWGGYEVRPTFIEFWQGQPSRMHDRVAYTAADGVPADLADGPAWRRDRLAP